MHPPRARPPISLVRPRFLGGSDDYHVAVATIASLDVVRGVRLSLLSMSRSLLQVSTHGASPRRSSSTSSKRCEYKHRSYSVRIMRLTTLSPGGSATETSSLMMPSQMIDLGPCRTRHRLPVTAGLDPSRDTRDREPTPLMKTS